MTPTTTIEVSGIRRALEVEVIVDTGFDGDLCLPIDSAVNLGLELVGTELVELADGSQKKELVFKGSVRFLGESRRARISLTESEDALLGTELMAGCLLSIDFESDRVRITRKHPKRRK